MADDTHAAIGRRDEDGPSGPASRPAAPLDREPWSSGRAHVDNRLRHLQKLATLGQLAGGIAHDVNNLLTSVLGYAGLLRVQAEPGDATHEAAATIEQAATTAGLLIKHLLDLARQECAEAVPVDLNEAMQQAAALLSRALDKRVRVVARPCAEPAVVTADPGQVQQIFLNLGINAGQAMANGGQVVFASELVGSVDAGCRATPGSRPVRFVRVTATDTGCGIPEHTRDRIFEPFFTTKKPGEGTGLGLSVVRGVVTELGGRIDVTPEAGQGTTFSVYLPLSAEAVAESAVARQRPSPCHATVLVVDDEPLVRAAASKMLRHAGYQVIGAASGAEAVDQYRRAGRRIDLVIVDMVMPDMDGQECLRALRNIDPSVKVLLSSGLGGDPRVGEFSGRGAVGALPKPYAADQLNAAVRRALSSESASPRAAS